MSKNSTKDFHERMLLAGQKFEMRLKPLAPPEQQCPHCFQCGFAWVVEDGMRVWVYCNCKEGVWKHSVSEYKLPLLTVDQILDKKVLAFPVKAFVPRRSGDVMGCIRERANAFTSDLRLSEHFWNEKLVARVLAQSAMPTQSK